jgi:hypothetical protein
MVLQLKSKAPIPREKPPVPQSFAADVPAGVEETSPSPSNGFDQFREGARQTLGNPAVMAALMQFGINLSSGVPIGQAIGGAGAAAGRVMEMQRQQQAYDQRAAYAAEDQAMQQGRYNMALTEQEQQEEYRKQQQANADRSFKLQERNVERLEKGTQKPGVSATTMFSTEKKRQAAKTAFIIKRAKEAVEAGLDPTQTSDKYLKDPAFIKESGDLFESLNSGEAGGAAPQAAPGETTPPPGAEGATTAAPTVRPKPKGKTDQQLFQEGQEALKRAGNDTAKRQMILDRMRSWGLVGAEQKNAN